MAVLASALARGPNSGSKTWPKWAALVARAVGWGRRCDWCPGQGAVVLEWGRAREDFGEEDAMELRLRSGCGFAGRVAEGWDALGAEA